MRVATTLGLCLPLVLTGCSLTPTAAPTPGTGLGIHGIVHGGQQPIHGAHLYVYAAAASGYESTVSPISSISLLNSNVVTNNPGYYGQDGNNNYYVVTDSNGNFNITNDYTCTSGQQVYLYAVSGDSGGGPNSAIGLMATLGNCPVAGNFSAITFVFMDEITTIASAYSMASFALDATHVSYSGSALGLTGITNAFANAANLANISDGTARSTPLSGNGTAPQSEINTLGDILAACINTSGPSSTGCTTLFSNAIPGTTGTTATDTATAAINIAHNPGANVATLYGSPTPVTPFTPNLSPQPNDFTIGLNFTGGGLSAPLQIAIDGSGNAWAMNSNVNGGNVSKFTSLGAAVSSPPSGFAGGGLSAGEGIAIDESGDVWVTNGGAGSDASVIELTNAGVPVTNSPFTGGGINDPRGLAIDGSGDVWITNLNAGAAGIIELNSSGTPVAGSPFTGGGLSAPWGIAIDGSGNAWIANDGGGVSELTSAGAAVSGSPFSGAGMYYPQFIAISNSGYIWVMNDYQFISELTDVGVPVLGTPFSSGGFNAIAVDSSNNVWIAGGTYSINELTSAGVEVTGAPFKAGGLYGTTGVAIDGSGDVWVANGGNSTISEFIGLTSPVVTPLSANLAAPYSAPASKP